MNVSNPRYEDDGIYPQLVLEIDGETVAMGEEATRPFWLSKGLVFVPGFEDRLPPIPYAEGTVDQTLLRGFTRDRAVVAAYSRFHRDLQDGTYRPGPQTRT